ncbi:hypothetical protein HYU89_03070 [Candidatus Collierbacteria bacterium]|nr:hypothetical protein [Candidatus Collierbacteria bacterium]
MKKPIFISILIILIFSLFGAKALFHSGFYTSHDGEHQLVRQYAFEQGLKDRQIPVRFSRQLYNGYGYPLFFFTYRLPFYAGEVFRLAGLSFQDSIKTVFFVAYIFSGLAMFWFARRWGNLAGLTAAILYMWVPYRFSVMFVRAALGEHAAAIFVPLLFGSISSGRKIKINVLAGTVAIVGLFLSHAMMAQIVLLAFIPWIVTHFFINRWKMSLRATKGSAAISSLDSDCHVARAPRNDESEYANNSIIFILKTIFMFILGVGLAAYYLIPAAAYRGLTQKLNPNYFADHFVTLKQLIYSPWGYAFSMKGVESDGMSFQVGMAQWIVVGLVIILVAIFLLKRSLLFARERYILIESISLLVIFFLSIFLMTEKSTQIWNWWKNYINIDMPWRFLLITTFSASALAGIVIKGLALSCKARPLLAIILVGLAIYTNRNHLRVNEYLNYPDSKLVEYRGTSNSDNEYRPKWDDGGIANTFKPEALISKGSGELTVIRSKSNLLELAVRADEDIRVDINTLYFPGWKVFVDGREINFKYAGEKGIIRIDLGNGYHMVEAKFSEPTAAMIGDLVSIGSLIALISVIKTLKHESTKTI